jgi:hypothetical protein
LPDRLTRGSRRGPVAKLFGRLASEALARPQIRGGGSFLTQSKYGSRNVILITSLHNQAA